MNVFIYLFNLDPE